MTLKSLRRYRWCNGAPWFEAIEPGETETEHAEYGGLVYKAAAVRRLVATLTRAQPEICLCAAVRLPNGYVVRGHRHDSAMRACAPYLVKGERITQDMQGFITSTGRFVGREEAMTLQRAAGMTQPDGRALVGAVLFSEDLY